MNSPCGAKALECQDYSKCDCTDETACGWWAYDRQVTDSVVSNAQHECALQRPSHTAPKHRVISKPRCLPRGKPDIQRGAVRQSSRGQPWYLRFSHVLDKNIFCSATHCRGGYRVFNCVPWCVCCLCKRKCRKNIKRKPMHMYVGVLLSHAWPESIATGFTV